MVGSPVHIWEQKLKRTKQAIKDWVKKAYKSPILRITTLSKEVEAFQEKTENAIITEDLLREEKKAFHSYHSTLRVEEEN
jgi:hypothetical protein